MADWDDVRRTVLELPQCSEGTSRGHLFWRVAGKGFVWERPLGRKDRAELGEAAPAGALLGARVESFEAKAALLLDAPEIYLTISHFDEHAIVLARMDAIPLDELHELIVEAWLARAPAALAAAYASEHLPAGGEPAR